MFCLISICVFYVYVHVGLGLASDYTSGDKRENWQQLVLLKSNTDSLNLEINFLGLFMSNIF